MTAYHVAVFGGGSVGLSLATSFATAGARVSLLVRQSAIETLRQTPIEVTDLLGDHVVPPERITLRDAAAPTEDVLNSDMLIFTTKAYDVERHSSPL